MRNAQRLFAPVFVIMALFLASSFLFADVTGSILGVVRDPSQAVVKGVRVTVTNTQTNLSQDSVTGDVGSYHFLALPAGTYRVNATIPGFQQFNTTDIVVKVNDQLRVDINLRVGNVKEEVSMGADAVQVETESTQLGDVIDSKKMLALPLNGRSYLDLLGLQAGVAPETAGTIGGDRPVSGYIQNAGNVSVNGQRETANAFLVNGGDVSEGRNLGAGLVPNIDSVEEFRLITNSFDAEYGKFSGSVMNAITKSGTNSIHGTVFEFLRNDKFDSTKYFDDGKAELRQNQFGYAVGGPLWKNKIFWFTDYQGTRIVSGASTGSVLLPSVTQRSGDFLDNPGGSGTNTSSFLTGNVVGNTWATVLTGRLGYTVNNGEPYYIQGGCNNTQCVFPNAFIPQSALAAPAIGILPYIPIPNVNAQTFSDNSQRNRVRDDKAAQRIDFNNQKTGNWSFYYHYDD